VDIAGSAGGVTVAGAARGQDASQPMRIAATGSIASLTLGRPCTPISSPAR